MKRITVGWLALSSLLLAGCSNRPTKEEFIARETECLHHYCSSNLALAETALIGCAQYAQECQRAGVEGILYDEVFARLYGRLYVVERHLGRSKAAEQTLEKYAHFHAISSSLARRQSRPHGEIVSLIEHKYDGGIRKGWKNK